MNANIIRRFCGSAILLAAMLSASCAGDDISFKEGEGAFSVSLQTDGSLQRRGTTRAADGEETLPAPEAGSFRIEVNSTDGSVSKIWETLDRLPGTEPLRIGDYTIEASYGDADEEGFEKPYFAGSSSFTVEEKKTTEVSLTASLANCLVTVSFSDDFNKFFTSYSAQVRSEQGAPFAILAGEKRPLYLVPGRAFINIVLRNKDGKSVTLEGANFATKPRTHYNVAFSYNEGNNGEGTIGVSFSEDLEEKEVKLDISDDLFNADPPQITMHNVDADKKVHHAAFSAIEKGPFCYISSPLGIKEAWLAMSSETYTPSFGKSIDLVQADVNMQAVMKARGLKVLGIWGNPGRSAQVDFSDALSGLPAGEHNVSLYVIDNSGRVTNPAAQFTIVSHALDFEIVSVDKCEVGATTASINVRFNGTDDFLKYFTAEIVDAYGVSSSTQILSAVKGEKVDGYDELFPSYMYKVTVKLPDAYRSSKLTFKSRFSPQITAETQITRAAVSYTLSVDAFANYARIKIASSTHDVALISDIISFGSDVEVLKRNSADGEVVIAVSPGKTYNLNSTVAETTVPVSFSTETAAAVPNGDFETVAQTLKYDALEQGGKYTLTLVSAERQNQVAFTVSEPQYWASVNQKTCWSGSSVKNSWFMIPSTFNSDLYWLSTGNSTYGGTQTPDYYNFSAQSGSRAMVIRNVAYDHRGTLPGTDKKTAVGDGAYNRNIPSISSRAAGELFLGSYAFNGSETKSEGISFASRPSSFSFYYRYIQDSQDTGEAGMVTISLLNGNDVIASGSTTLSASDAFRHITIPLYYSSARKATSLRIMFKSSNRAESAIKTTAIAARFQQESYGATLVVDNLTFGYDVPAAYAASKAAAMRKNRSKATSKRIRR